MKHLDEFTKEDIQADIEAHDKKIEEFAQEFVTLWLDKYRDFERYDLLVTLLKLIINPNAKYYKLEAKERDAWLLTAILKLYVELEDTSHISVSKKAQLESIYNQLVKFDDADMCSDCKADLKELIRADYENFMRSHHCVPRPKKKRRWWNSNKSKSKENLNDNR